MPSVPRYRQLATALTNGKLLKVFLDQNGVIQNVPAPVRTIPTSFPDYLVGTTRASTTLGCTLIAGRVANDI